MLLVILTSFNAHAVPSPSVRTYWSPKVVAIGEYSTYSWSTTNATSCRNGNGRIFPTNGSKRVRMSQAGTSTSRLTCSGLGGSRVSLAVITVGKKPSINSSWSPKNIAKGEYSTYSWSTTNATSCKNGNGKIFPTSGYRRVRGSHAGTSRSLLTCTNSIGSTRSYADITVWDKPTVKTSWSDKSVSKGSYSTYRWSSTNATSCKNGNGRIFPTSGSKRVIMNSIGTSTSRLTCTGVGGSTISYATITVNKASPPIISASWSLKKVFRGQKSTYQWSAMNATSCVNNQGVSVPTSGKKIEAHNKSGTFVSRMTCKGSGGTRSAKASIDVSSIAFWGVIIDDQGRGLQNHETIHGFQSGLGHTIKTHINILDVDLGLRCRANHRLEFASTYNNYAGASFAIKDLIKKKQQHINSVMNSADESESMIIRGGEANYDSNAVKCREARLHFSIIRSNGRLFYTHATYPRLGIKQRLVLRKKSSAPGGWYLVTAFPDYDFR